MKSILEYNNSIDQGEDEGGLTGALRLSPSLTEGTVLRGYRVHVCTYVYCMLCVHTQWGMTYVYCIVYCVCSTIIGASLSETQLVRCMPEVPVAVSVIRTFTR